MKWAKVVEKLHRYFEYIGISYQFEPNGRFGHIDIDAALTKAFSPEKMNEEDRLSLTSAIEGWDGSFEMLYTVERDLEKLTLEAIIPTNISQNILMEKWKIFSRLVGWPIPEELEKKEGYCSGITDASGVGILLKQNPNLKLDPTIPVDKFIHFEDVMYRIQGWDEHTVTSDIQSDFEFFRDYVLVFQERQSERNRVINELLKCELVADPECVFSWVHNEESLKRLILKALTPGKYTYIAANRHAAHIFVTPKNEVFYFNSNEPLGSLFFTNIKHFLYRLPKAFNNCYSDRLGLSVVVYDVTGSKVNKLDLQSLIEEMIQCQLEAKNKITTPTVSSNKLANEKDKNSPSIVPSTNLAAEKTEPTDINVNLSSKSLMLDRSKLDFINRQDNTGITALHMSCAENNSEEVSVLIELRANPNIKELDYLATPLHFAARKKDVSCLQNLCKSELLQMNEVHRGGYAPLHVAVLYGLPEAVDYLLKDSRVRVNLPTQKKCNEPGHTALQLAAKYNLAHQIPLLLSHPDIMINYQEKTLGLTALHIAVKEAASDSVQALIQRKDKVGLNLRSNETSTLYPQGKTPLDYAMELEDDLEIAMLLFQAGADINLLPTNQCWRLMSKLLEENLNTNLVGHITDMLAHGHRINIGDVDFVAFVEKLIYTDNAKVLEFLLENCPDLLQITLTIDSENTDSNNEKPYTSNLLHLAVVNESLKSIESLLQHDATLADQKDSTGCPPRAFIDSASNKIAIRKLFKQYTMSASQAPLSEHVSIPPTMISNQMEISTQVQEASVTDFSIFKPVDNRSQSKSKTNNASWNPLTKLPLCSVV